MKKLFVIVTMLSMAACGNIDPVLNAPPKNQAKYEADVAACRKEAQGRYEKSNEDNQTHGAAIGTFGLLGYLVDHEANADDSDFYKSKVEMRDECLKKRGYQVKA